MTRTPVAIHTTSAMAAVVGAVLSPIPLIDEILLLPLYSALTLRIAHAHRVRLFSIPWRPIMSTTFSGLFARAALNLTVGLIPGVAAVANGVSAFALTEFLGRYIDDACIDPSKATPIGVRGIFAKLSRRAPAAAAAAEPA